MQWDKTAKQQRPYCWSNYRCQKAQNVLTLSPTVLNDLVALKVIIKCWLMDLFQEIHGCQRLLQEPGSPYKSNDLLLKHLLKKHDCRRWIQDGKMTLETWLNIHIPLPWLQILQQAIHYLRGIKEPQYEISDLHVFVINMGESSYCISKISDLQIYLNASVLTSPNVISFIAVSRSCYRISGII